MQYKCKIQSPSVIVTKVFPLITIVCLSYTKVFGISNLLPPLLSLSSDKICLHQPASSTITSVPTVLCNIGNNHHTFFAEMIRQSQNGRYNLFCNKTIEAQRQTKNEWILKLISIGIVVMIVVGLRLSIRVPERLWLFIILVVADFTGSIVVINVVVVDRWLLAVWKIRLMVASPDWTWSSRACLPPAWRDYPTSDVQRNWK